MAWLPSGSLKGPQGIDGIQGPSGIQGLPGADGAAGTQGVPGEAGPQGPAGVDGPQGQQGIQGAAGTGINFRGNVATVADLPASAAQGDAYIVQADDSLRVWDSVTAAWVDGGSIQGPQGIDGAVGAAGPQGEVGPAGTIGPDGPAGVQGTRGTGWFTGTGAPTDVPGSVPGDLYLESVTGDVYVLK